MSADESGKQFDRMLEQALRRHTESVPVDFTDKMLSQIREKQQQEILARVVLQERLALAGCITLGIMVVAVAVVFPGIAVSLTEWVEIFIGKAAHIIDAAGSRWQFYMFLVGVFGYAVYSFLDLLLGDNRQ